jgi:hypothetical protein
MQFKKADWKAVAYVYENMREDNRTELVVNKVTRRAVQQTFSQSRQVIAIYGDDGLPMGVFGIRDAANGYMVMWGFFTDEADANRGKNWVRITSLGRAWVREVKAATGNKLAIGVWDARVKAIEWMKKLGFALACDPQTGQVAEAYIGENRLVMLESV